MKTPLLPSLLAGAGGLAAAGALAAPASAATAWNCGASSVYASVLGQPATAPFVANGGAAECKNARASHQPLDASSPLSAGVFVAQTELVGDQPATQVAKASGGVAELRVRSLPTLPVELPALTLDDALGSVSVPLTGALQPLVDDLNAQIADLEVALLGTVAGAGTGTVKSACLTARPASSRVRSRTCSATATSRACSMARPPRALIARARCWTASPVSWTG
ncbi:MAG: hypothetical protein M3Q39_15545 [Actinomycetota bacterium]|nr:hypothetical protein [Actinomycetota bacterium]